MKDRLFFIDAACVFLCCALLAVFLFPGSNVAALLLLIIGTALPLLLSGRLLYAAELLLPLLSLAAPEAVIFLPTALYFSAVNRHRLPAAETLAVLAVSLHLHGDMTGIPCTTAAALLAGMLGLRSGTLSRRSNELIRTRDADTETELALRQKNEELIRRQDDEVNIATLKERNRIAREIHDNVGHLLSRALLQSGALLAVTDKEQLPLQHAQISALKDTLSSAMNSIRESVHGLRDDSIDLHHAVREAAEPVSERFRVQTELDFSENMPAKVKLCFIAVIKEALSNAVKHSTGDTIRIIIREHPALYQLCIQDNGAPEGIAMNGGMGLSNMRERAEQMGGIFRLDTTRGFKIFISVNRTEGTP